MDSCYYAYLHYVEDDCEMQSGKDCPFYAWVLSTSDCSHESNDLDPRILHMNKSYDFENMED